MPTNSVLSRFLAGVEDQLQKPIRAYYDVVDKFGPSSIQATIAQSLTRAEMERVLRNVHIQAALIGSAGNMTDAQRAELNRVIASDERYLDGFMDALPRLSRTQAEYRANLYAGTARNTVQQVETVEIPLPIRPRDGQTECTFWCKCSLNIVYLFGASNYDVYWKLSEAEHCADCIRLSETWAPLRIRNGKIVGAKMIAAPDFDHLKYALLNARIAA